MFLFGLFLGNVILQNSHVNYTTTIHMKSFTEKFPCVTPLKWLQRIAFKKLPLHPARQKIYP